MSRWTIDHPGSKLDRVLDDISAGIDNGKDLLGLIPDSPFPARSLVTALGCLVKLGTVGNFDQSVFVFSNVGCSDCNQGEGRCPEICQGRYPLGERDADGVSE
jgi:hypothetical protein